MVISQKTSEKKVGNRGSKTILIFGHTLRLGPPGSMAHLWCLALGWRTPTKGGVRKNSIVKEQRVKGS